MTLRTHMIGKDAVPVTLALDAAQGKMYPHKGTLKFSEVTVDETTGSIALRAEMPNPDDILLPGLFVRATLDLGQNTVILVPQRATTRSADGSLTVWVVDQDNKAQPRNIDVDKAYKDNWIVTTGLKSGDKVIIEGYQKVAASGDVTTTAWQADSTEEKNPENTQTDSGKE